MNKGEGRQKIVTPVADSLGFFLLFGDSNRPEGFERQYRMTCKRCGLWVAYEPSDGGSQYTYLVEGSLVRDEASF